MLSAETPKCAQSLCPFSGDVESSKNEDLFFSRVVYSLQFSSFLLKSLFLSSTLIQSVDIAVGFYPNLFNIHVAPLLVVFFE